MPLNRLVACRFYNAASLNPAASSFDTASYAANDIYDCDATSGGGQPATMATEIQQYYRGYRVVKSDCIVRFHHTEATNYVLFALGRTTGLGSFTTFNELRYSPMCARKTMPPVSTDQQKHVILRQNYKQRRDQATIPELASGSTGGSPTDPYYFAVCYGPNNETTDIGACSFEIWITYYVFCFDRNEDYVS